jgi:glycosyltransferase involved in cell wall biosynthesis
MGEYSNVHWTLAEGLRALGHQVTVLSNGDFFKDYPRDIDLVRQLSTMGGVKYVARLLRFLPQLKGYDVVQLINPMFLELKAGRIKPVYHYLRRHNRSMFLGAFGMDYYWVHENDTRKPLRYSDFNIGNQLRHNADAEKERRDWLGTDKERLNKLIAADCDGIISGLYEYMACYEPVFPQKTTFIPFPIMPKDNVHVEEKQPGEKVRLFIGVNRERSEYKGTDIMLRAARRVASDYPDKVELRVAENVPFKQYVEMMNGSDAILDQLYSYTPSMNPLEAMSRGLICVGGGEPENYEILGEKELRPIINVEPNEQSVYSQLEQLVLHPERIGELKRQSVEYIRRHHDYRKVARQYLDFYVAKGNL